MNLSSIFTDVAHKQLVSVDLPECGSNQHELNGVAALREFFGTQQSVNGTLQWHYFADDKDPVQAEDDFTFYDARAKSAKRTNRSEWRFYYYGNFLVRANPGDWFFLVRTQTGRLLALIFQRGSSWFRAAQALFGVRVGAHAFDSIEREKLEMRNIELLRRQILMELGLEVVLPVRHSDEAIMTAKFGLTFPTTKDMSTFARSQVEADSDQIDETLVRWLDREEELFLALERVIISERLKTGFPEVEQFIDFSLSVHQRRKSRMGFAFQNHLAEMFNRHRIRYSAQAITEGKRKPDFIFPGQTEYRDATFDASLLVMLGVKATCKDRWRQVLVEARRIPNKHLCTLEAGISTQQTDEMQEEQVTLVVPVPVQVTYTSGQRKRMLSLSEFVDFVRLKQSEGH